jgi:hypothetical protein
MDWNVFRSFDYICTALRGGTLHNHAVLFLSFVSFLLHASPRGGTLQNDAVLFFHFCYMPPHVVAHRFQTFCLLYYVHSVSLPIHFFNTNTIK